jgi:antitoxin component of RelBE/YafQ-DinJ toxin-antitoxin module
VKSRQLFEKFGLDMTAAINLFLRQAIRKKAIPFVISEKPVSVTRRAGKKPNPGGWERKIWMAGDFNALLEDFKNYIR